MCVIIYIYFSFECIHMPTRPSSSFFCFCHRRRFFVSVAAVVCFHHRRRLVTITISPQSSCKTIIIIILIEKITRSHFGSSLFGSSHCGSSCVCFVACFDRPPVAIPDSRCCTISFCEVVFLHPQDMAEDPEYLLAGSSDDEADGDSAHHGDSQPGPAAVAPRRGRGPGRGHVGAEGHFWALLMAAGAGSPDALPDDLHGFAVDLLGLPSLLVFGLVQVRWNLYGMDNDQFCLTCRRPAGHFAMTPKAFYRTEWLNGYPSHHQSRSMGQPSSTLRNWLVGTC